MRAMQGGNDKLVTKSAFMLRNMLVLNPSHKCKYQFIEIILGYCTVKHGRMLPWYLLLIVSHAKV